MTQLKELYNKLGTYPDFPSEGVIFKDIFPLLKDPDLTFQLIEELSKTIPAEVTCIVAPESRGFLLGMLLAYRLELKFVPLRKPGKLPGEVYYTTIETEYSQDRLEIQRKAVLDEECWFVDDIYATGGTYKGAQKLVNKCEGTLLGGSVLLDVLGKAPNSIIELFREVK